jgi:hypothetical protein
LLYQTLRNAETQGFSGNSTVLCLIKVVNLILLAAISQSIKHDSFLFQANADISQGDLSETKADRKYRQHSQATEEKSPVRIVVLGLRASTPIEASPVEDQRGTDAPEAEHGYQQQEVVVDVPKPPSTTPQQPKSPSPQQHEVPPAPVVAQSQHQLANGPVSFRRRPRKMAHPVRAPFF